MAVSKNELIGARQSKQILELAIAALKAINTQSLNYDPYSMEKLSSFITWLQKFEAKADAIISQAQSQYENRPLHLINAAAIRVNAILSDIELHQKTAELKISAHQSKVEEMKKRGFSSAEIEAITPYPQAELNEHESAISALKVERKNIETFLASSPAFDVSLLDQSKLIPYLQYNNSTGEAQ